MNLKKEDLTSHDREEVEKFESYLYRIDELKKEGLSHWDAVRKAHSEIYGDVIHR